ncbi:hypothetical protein A2257_03715 [Candidatus Falkowbacteria bacterium RIFOXYA2_FULL_38_12]|uniref:Uncharacterized protein n=1 Tax=Candidatus Falkowbacteria bacterium RIFOXYA2_FULL_38_12 TaxID=1797993 RepID=A0A1F5S492_9BACT|nr:MAG: hypothetical protein A2257_03715 [Candidatus Falkowbacteria bacterium RIFOXYA2_FULL_38_12]
MKSQLTSIFLFTAFVGDILAGLMASIYPTMTPANYFGLLTAMMMVVSVIFYFVAKNYDKKKAVVETVPTTN